MKYVLDEKDRARPWYKGMSNMEKEEIDEWFKNECRAALMIGVELLVFGIVGIVLWLISPDNPNRESLLYLIMGVNIGMGFMVLIMLECSYRHVKLTKEEKDT